MPAHPLDSAEASGRLAAVRAKIAQLTQRLGAELARRDAQSSRLREVELLITGKRQRLEALRLAAGLAERRREELRGEQARAEHKLQAERAALAAQARAAYLIGRQEQLKLLLNQSDPASLGRTLAYYGYFARQRSGKINSIRDEALELQRMALQIDEQGATLRTLESDASREMAGLERARAERAEAIATLTRRVASGNQQLEKLQREEQAVESLVADLARVLEDFPLDATQSFERLRGNLPWPVQGRLTASYGLARENSAAGMRWNGVMIEAARGAKVRAAYFGRVVYADWLQGLGLLLIIGHSGGFMTLYGHAEVLYKSVGDWVAPGDVIAALGDSDAAPPQLYFEIRKGRKTVDPALWLRSAPR